MSTRLVYHTPISANGGLSPFDEAIRSIVLNGDVGIVCPYLGLNYLKRICLLSRSWRILTDVEEWLASFSYESRQQIYSFISQHSESIRHCKDLHAKVILAGDKALLGSANFTEKGITGRTEVSVIFEAEPQVEELQKWFESLWLQSSAMQLSEIATYIDSLPSQGNAEGSSALIGLSSNAPKVRSRLTAAKEPRKAVNTQQYDSSHGRLVQIIRQAPNREWIDEYFDLLSELISFTGLEDGDPRFVSSLPQGGVLPVTINRRYVLAAFRRGKPLTGFIFGVNYEQLPEMISSTVHSWRFKPFSGEVFEQTPYFLRLEGSPKDVLTSEQKAAWRKAVLFEVDHGQVSPYQKYHASVVYQAAVDLEYRALVLDEAFQELNAA